MKKLNFVILLVLCACFSLNMHAVITVATTASASVPNNPAVVLRPQNSGAASTTVFFGATNYTVEVNCWDIGVFPSTGGGFSWRTYSAGPVYLNPGGVNGDFILMPNAVDIDVSIIREFGVARLVVAYYNTATLTYMYDIYNLNAAGMFILSSGPNAIVGSATLGTINVDASADYGFAITCDRPGTGIFSLTGLLNPGLTISAVRQMNASAGFMRPDVTIQRYSGNLRIYWVYTNTAQTTVTKSDMDFFVFHPGVGVYIPGGVNNYVAPVGFRTQFPRIDAPDAFGTANQRWAWVCEIRSATASRIMTRYNDAFTSTATVSTLGATGLSAAATINSKPIVTWNNNTVPPRIEYAWHTTQAGIAGLSNPLGFYVAADLNTATNTLAPGLDYLSVSTIPFSTSPTPTLAFSCNNSLPNLFTTYAVLFGGAPYQMRVKNGAWGGPLYKTSPEDDVNTLDVKETSASAIYPSFVSNNITYEISEVSDNMSILVLDLNGQVAHSQKIVDAKGDINLNFLSNGMYIVNILDAGNVIKTVKINKN